MSFSENLQTLRKAQGISQEQLAERLDVSRQAVSKWETDGGYPEMDKIVQLCDLFGVTMDELVKGHVEVDKADIRKKYDEHFGAFAKGIATGVFLIIAGVAASTFLSFSSIFGESWQSLGSAVMFIFIAIGVAVLTVFGIKNGNFRKEHPVIPEIYTAEERERFNTKIFPYFISGGVSLILVGVVLTTVEVIKAGNAVFLLLVAAAAWLFVYAGLTHGKYDIKEYNRERDFEQGIKDTDPPEIVRQKKRKTLAQMISGVIMLSATAVFLLIGFVWNIWSPTWAIFPVCAIICAIVNVVLEKW